MEDEDEIIVEYFDDFEVDPLCDNSLKHKSRDSRQTDHCFTSNNVLNDVVNEDVISERIEDSSSNQPLVDDENNDPNPVEPENKWYKSVNNIGRYVCSFCELSYSTTQTLRNHIKVKHAQNYTELKDSMNNSLRKRKLKCHICKMKFTNTTNLQEHIQTHGMKNIQKSCCICHATFEGIVEMLNHMISEHKSLKKRLHFCSICGYSTSKLSHFKQHENTHTRSNKIKCFYCDYSTNYLPNLNTHVRIHTNYKPYVCGYEGCSYRCAAKSALYSHQLKHDREKNMLYCDKCSYSTVYKNSLKKHIDSHNRNSLRKRF